MRQSKLMGYLELCRNHFLWSDLGLEAVCRVMLDTKSYYGFLGAYENLEDIGKLIKQNPGWARIVIAGASVGLVGGLIGLGGAEFRLPLLIGLFGFAALEAVILNKATSLIVVAVALPFRAGTVPLDQVFAAWPIILNLLTGSLIGAWLGVGLAVRMKSRTLYRVLAGLLILIAVVLASSHALQFGGNALLTGGPQIIAGLIAGLSIGIVASLMGVAGGELLIPTLVLLFGVDVRLAGSLSLAISLPTMLVGFARYAQDDSFSVLSRNRGFVGLMAVGSVVGVALGGQLLGIVSETILLPLLVVILLVSSVKVWRHA